MAGKDLVVPATAPATAVESGSPILTLYKGCDGWAGIIMGTDIGTG